MASFLANSLRSGKKAQDKVGSDPHMSQVLTLNGNHRIFFRTVTDEDGMVDLAAGLVPGRVLDYDICGASFIPFKPGMFEKNDMDEIKDLTGLDAWARIARVIHNAQCIREKKNAEAEAERSARELGKPVDQLSLSRAIEAIELSYNGGKAADGTRINPKKSPAISGIKRKLTTQIAVVGMLPNGAPDWKNARYAVLELSNSRRDELLTILDEANFVQPGKGWLEVGFSYIGSDKKEAGKKAKFQGIVQAMSLETMFPAEWEAAGKKFIEGLANGPDLNTIAEIIISRNRNLKGGKSPADIISAFKQWCATNAAVFGSINFEEESTLWAAKDFLENHLVDSMPAIKDQFAALLTKSENENESATSGDDANAQAASAPEVQSEIQKEQSDMAQAAELADAGVGRSMRELATSVPDIELDDDELGEI